MTFEMVLAPDALISELSAHVVKLTKTLHLVSAPVAIVHSAVIVIESTLAMPHTFQLLSFVSRSLFVDLPYELSAFTCWQLYLWPFIECRSRDDDCRRRHWYPTF